MEEVVAPFTAAEDRRQAKRRWVVERTFAWLGNYRRPSKDDEFLPATEENLIHLAMSRLMLRRLCRPAKR